MRWPEDKTNPFPSRHRQEPSGLRADILDELADHLALSAEREMATNGQPREAAWARALDRFGDPDAVARRLWWDAMKGKIMRDWIQTGVSAVSAIVVVLVAVYVVMNMQAMQVTQTQLAETLQKMDSRAQTAAGEMLDIEVRRGTPDGPPAAGVHVKLKGKVNGDTDADVVLDTDAAGHAKFFPVPQGKYNLELADPQSCMTLRTEHSLFAGMGSTHKFVAPDITAVRARFVTDPPLSFPNDRMVVYMNYSGKLSVGDNRWLVTGECLAGSAGFHELARTADQYRRNVKQPVPALLLPPIELEAEAIPKFRNPEDPPDSMRFAVDAPEFDSRQDQQVTLTPGQENTVTLKLTEGQVKAATRYMMSHTAKKWLPNFDAGADPPFDAYVAAAFPIEDAKRVYCEQKGDGRAEVTLPSVGTNQDAAAGSGLDWLMLRIADPASLAKTYPAKCRFLIVHAKIDSTDLSPWTGAACSPETGQPFTVDLGKAFPQLPLYDAPPRPGRPGTRQYSLPPPITGGGVLKVDVTDFIRGDAASASCAGVIVHAPAGELDIITPPIAQEEYKGRAPYLLVLRDTPPDDL